MVLRKCRENIVMVSFFPFFESVLFINNVHCFGRKPTTEDKHKKVNSKQLTLDILERTGVTKKIIIQPDLKIWVGLRISTDQTRFHPY